jgi:hypothetical protein
MNRSEFEGNIRRSRWVGAGRSLMKNGPVPSSYLAAGNIVLTISDIYNGFMTIDSGGVARNLTTPTAAQIVNLIPGALVGDMINVQISNGSAGAFALTLVAGTGVTFDPNLQAAARVINQNAQRTVWFRVVNNAPGSEAVVCYM